MGRLSQDEYFKLYDKKLREAYFSDALLLPDDPCVKYKLLDVRKTLHRLNDTTDKLFRYTTKSGIDWAHENNPNLLKYIDTEGKDCLLYCLDNNFANAIHAVADNLPQEKVDLALMFYASDFYASFGFRSKEIYPSSPSSATLIYKAKANPHAIIETEMPTVDDKEKKEIARNTPFMYFLEKNSNKEGKPFIPSPARFPYFYEDCPFTLKNPQGETLFSLFIKRHLYREAEELLDLMSDSIPHALSPKEMNDAINIQRTDAHFREAEKGYGFTTERSMYVEGNIKKTESIEDNRRKMRKLGKKIHDVYEENKKAIDENKKAEKRATKESQKSQEKAVEKKVAQWYQATFDF